jgi:hypothetical protein
MARHRKASERASRAQKKTLDTFPQKRRRGRPPTVVFEEIVGRGDNNRWILDQVWESLWPILSSAKSEDEIVKAFQEGAGPYAMQFVPAFSTLIFEVLREKTFPRRRKPRISFMADSLAGLGVVRPRRSRDICAEERAKAKREHHILRYEYYVECSCGYKGPSKDHACRKCGAKINQFFPLP